MSAANLIKQWIKDSLHNVLVELLKDVAATYATKEALARLDNRLQMQVEGLPYVTFGYDFDNGDLHMEYVEGTDIVEDNITYEDGDLIVTPTAETT